MKILLRSLVVALASTLTLVSAQKPSQTAVGPTISGKLLRSNGRPLPNTEIELIPEWAEHIVIDPGMNAVSRRSGGFRFSNVPPGKYVLSINYREKPTDLSPYDSYFYPGVTERAEAKILTVTPETKMDSLVFKLPPPLVSKEIEGRVVDEFGRPITDAFVSLWDTKLGGPLDYELNILPPTGKFSIPAFLGRWYQVGALQFLGGSGRIHREEDIIGVGETPIFVLRESTAPFEIRVHIPGEEKRTFLRYIASQKPPSIFDQAD